MRKLTLALGLAIVAGCGTAQAAAHEHDMSPRAVQTAASLEGWGVLKAVNAQAGKVKIAHQPIDALGWPAMTMWFAVRVPLPNEARVGDRVRFEMEQVQSEEWVITRIERKR